MAAILFDQFNDAPDWKQALRTGALDAAIWVWFLQTAYASRFTMHVSTFTMPDVQLYAWFSITCVIVSAALMAARWDAVPRAYRIACAVGDSLFVALLLALDLGGQGGTLLGLMGMTGFVAFYFGSQILRVDTLARCSDGRTLALSLIVSLCLYYALSALLLLLPQPAYDATLVLLPLTLLYPAVSPRSKAREAEANDTFDRPVNIDLLRKPSTAVFVLFGIAGGLLSSSGESNPAMHAADVFSYPSPAHLCMVLANMALGIAITRRFRVRRATCYAFMGVVWMVGTFIGAAAFTALNAIPEIVFTAIAIAATVAVALTLILNQDAWLRRSKGSATPANRLEGIARRGRLTPRETEVLALLMEGRSIPYIQNALCISEGTARTHAKHIYTKLGVHSKQELIDLARKDG